MTPRGRGRGRRRGRRRRVTSFLQPCLLVLLHREPAHGYALLNELDKFGFNLEVLDPTLMYRSLRDMEGEGLVTSYWDNDSLGPQRRVYSITEQGEAYMKQWVKDLQRTRREIDSVLAAYEKVVAEIDEGGDTE